MQSSRVNDYERLQELCRLNFAAFAEQAFSIVEPGTKFEYNWTIGCIAEHLEASFRGELPRLIINIMPRELKSMLVAQFFPAWVLGLEPHHQFIGASYAHSLAERNVVKCRQVLTSDFYLKTYPDTIISPDQNKKDYFTTTTSGQYKGTGIGGTLTGFGCNTLLMDDVLSPKEGMSDTIRATTNDEIRSTLFSRFNDSRTARTILVMQRIHSDDPTGNLLRDGGWHLLKLPAEAKSDLIISLGSKKWEMKEGDLLNPVRSPREVLDQKRTDLGDANYIGQFMQEPAPVGGGEFRPEWFQTYQQGGIKPRNMNICILVDQAGGEEFNKKKRKLSDFSVIAVVGLGEDNNYYLLDMIRDRLNPTDRVNSIFLMVRKWAELSGKQPKVGAEQVGLATDNHYLKEKQRQDAYNFPIIPLRPDPKVSKEQRIRRLIPDVQNGRWWLPATLPYVDAEGRKIDLVEEFLRSEVMTFPRSRFDDMMDVISYTYNEDLHMVFPRPKVSLVNKTLKKYSEEANDSGGWRDF